MRILYAVFLREEQILNNLLVELNIHQTFKIRRLGLGPFKNYFDDGVVRVVKKVSTQTA